MKRRNHFFPTGLFWQVLLMVLFLLAAAGCGDDDDDDDGDDDGDDDDDDDVANEDADDDVDDDVDDDIDDDIDDDADDDVDDDVNDDADDDLDPHIFSYDFEDDAVGSKPNLFQWFLYGDIDGVIVTDNYPTSLASPAGNVVEIDKLRYDTSVSMRHLYIPLIQENFAISYDWNVTRANCGFRMWASLMNWGFDDTLYSIEASSSTDTFNVWTDYDPEGGGATPIDAGPVTDAWVNVRIEVNYDTLTTTTFFDDVPVAEDLNFFSGDYPYVGSFGWIIFSNVGSGELYVDNIELWYMWDEIPE
jgi:hypothetical protein